MANPTHVAIIGAGPGGYPAAFLAADLGMQVTLIDEEKNPGRRLRLSRVHPLEGAAARRQGAWTRRSTPSSFGRRRSPRRRSISTRLRGFKDGVVAKMTGGHGAARQVAEDPLSPGPRDHRRPAQVSVALKAGGEESVTFDVGIIATGSRPATLPNLSLSPGRLLDSTSALDLPDVPRSRCSSSAAATSASSSGRSMPRSARRSPSSRCSPGLLPGADRDLVKVLADRIDHDLRVGDAEHEGRQDDGGSPPECVSFSNLGTEPGDLRQVLRDKIDACEGLIQIVGQGYGLEPPIVDANYRRVSYTQFEFLYAREKKKKTWLLFAGDACTRDTPLAGLDLPNDPAHAAPATYQAQRRALQLAYSGRLQKDGHPYDTAISDTDLELKVERLCHELAEPERASKLWKNKVLRALAVGFVVLALIGGSVWWFDYSQHREIRGISKEARHMPTRNPVKSAERRLTREKIRAQLLASVERAREAALADAQKAKGWEARERLRQAAEKAYAGSISRIDELAASFAEIEGTARSSQVLDEMTRILAEEGVDQALAYFATQRPAILEKVKARADKAGEKNRSDLLPAQERPARGRTQPSRRGRTPLRRHSRSGAGVGRAAKRLRVVSDPARRSDRTGGRKHETPRSRSNLPTDSCPQSTGEIASGLGPDPEHFGLSRFMMWEAQRGRRRPRAA